MPHRYAVRLTAAERAVLADVIAAAAAPARTQTHARILRKADEGAGGPAWTAARAKPVTGADNGCSLFSILRHFSAGTGVRHHHGPDHGRLTLPGSQSGAQSTSLRRAGISQSDSG